MKKQTVLMVILSLSLFFLGLFLGSQSASIPSNDEEVTALQTQLSTLQQKLEKEIAFREEYRLMAQDRGEELLKLQGDIRDTIKYKNHLIQNAGSGLTQKELKEFGKMVEYKGYLLPSWPASLGITIPNVDVEAIRQYNPEDKEPLAGEYIGRNESRIFNIGLSAPMEEKMFILGEMEVVYNHWTIGQFKSYQRYALDVEHAFTREYEGKGIYPKDFGLVDSLFRWHGLSPTGAKVKERLEYVYNSQFKQAIALIDADPELQKVFKKQ